MTVRTILDIKGRDVVTVHPSAMVAEVAGVLAQKRIGAVVVTERDERIAGIISERDIVRALSEHGADALSRPASAIMTADVGTCRESHTINELMEMMTRGRFRHLPVERDGKLAGIVSIGDVVKARIEEVEREAEEIRTYIATA
jgi:CBS domain-containing protein